MNSDLMPGAVLILIMLGFLIFCAYQTRRYLKQYKLFKKQYDTNNQVFYAKDKEAQYDAMQGFMKYLTIFLTAIPVTSSMIQIYLKNFIQGETSKMIMYAIIALIIFAIYLAVFSILINQFSNKNKGE